MNCVSENSAVVKSIQVVKMRRTAHDQSIYGMEITKEGIVMHTDVRV